MVLPIHTRPSSPVRGPVDPPITKSTLSELDVTKIVHNSKLRHDINFDPDLHFRPNLEGEKGRKKQDKIEWFWWKLSAELTEFVADPVKFRSQLDGEMYGWCLPKLLKTYHEILSTLVPQRDRQFLDEGLNLELLMQQFYNGVLDLDKLAFWLSCVLKSHCAPMRDDEVDAMYSRIEMGNERGDIEQIVHGLKQLLSVLEHMKLDVANHQIRCLRAVLIDDTIQFEQRYFSKRIRDRKFNILQARQWYQEVSHRYNIGPAEADGYGDMATLFQYLSHIVLPSAAGQWIPETFQHDYDRLSKLRSDILDLVNLEICMRQYEQIESFASASYSQAMKTFDTSAQDCAPSGSRSSSLVFSPASFSPVSSVSSSPRSSLDAMPAYLAHDQNDVKAKARNLRRSLLAILHQQPHTADPSIRWQAVAPLMALEIIRATDMPSMLRFVAETLMSSFSRPDSSLYRENEQKIYRQMMEKLGSRVREYNTLSAVGIYSAATEGVLQYKATTPFFQRTSDLHLEEGGMNDIAKRVAHLGILHWRIWAPLAYNGRT